jgi:hypothetical protein
MHPPFFKYFPLYLRNQMRSARMKKPGILLLLFITMLYLVPHRYQYIHHIVNAGHAIQTISDHRVKSDGQKKIQRNFGFKSRVKLIKIKLFFVFFNSGNIKADLCFEKICDHFTKNHSFDLTLPVSGRGPPLLY